MVSALTDMQVTDIFGILYNDISAAKSRIITGEAGFDVGLIPDGMDEDGKGTRRPPIFSAVDGQWSLMTKDRREKILPRLSKSLMRHLRREINLSLISA
jgi:hypothetical protein